MKMLADKVEGDQIASNGSHTIDGNGCTDMAGDSVNKVECSLKALEADDCIDGTFATDDVRPQKKAKSSIDESCSSHESNKGSFSFSGMYCY